jgi:hypothetical protein
MKFVSHCQHFSLSRPDECPVWHVLQDECSVRIRRVELEGGWNCVVHTSVSEEHTVSIFRAGEGVSAKHCYLLSSLHEVTTQDSNTVILTAADLTYVDVGHLGWKPCGFVGRNGFRQGRTASIFGAEKNPKPAARPRWGISHYDVVTQPDTLTSLAPFWNAREMLPFAYFPYVFIYLVSYLWFI